MLIFFKKIFTTVFVTILLFLPLSSSAQEIDTFLDDAQKASGYKTAGETTFAQNIGIVVKTVMSFAGIIFLSLMVYAGFLWMTAHGEEQQISKAQKIIRGSIIGLIIAVGAYSITAFIVPKILVQTTGTSGQTGGPQSGVCKWEGSLSSGSETKNKSDCTRTWCSQRAEVNNTTLEKCTFNGIDV